MCIFSTRGELIGAHGIKCDSGKIKSIIDWPTPTDKTGLQSILGLCSYYRKFVPNFAMIAKPLHRLTEVKTPFVWNREC